MKTYYKYKTKAKAFDLIYASEMKRFMIVFDIEEQQRRINYLNKCMLEYERGVKRT